MKLVNGNVPREYCREQCINQKTCDIRRCVVRDGVVLNTHASVNGGVRTEEELVEIFEDLHELESK